MIDPTDIPDIRDHRIAALDAHYPELDREINVSVHRGNCGNSFVLKSEHSLDNSTGAKNVTGRLTLDTDQQAAEVAAILLASVDLTQVDEELVEDVLARLGFSNPRFLVTETKSARRAVCYTVDE